MPHGVLGRLALRGDRTLLGRVECLATATTVDDALCLGSHGRFSADRRLSTTVSGDCGQLRHENIETGERKGASRMASLFRTRGRVEVSRRRSLGSAKKTQADHLAAQRTAAQKRKGQCLSSVRRLGSSPPWEHARPSRHDFTQGISTGSKMGVALATLVRTQHARSLPLANSQYPPLKKAG